MIESILLISQTASLVALVLLYLQLQQKKKQLSSLQRIDEATQVLSKHALQAELNQAFSAAKRYQLPLTLGIISFSELDLSNAKQLKQFKQTAQHLKRLLRLTDCLGRYSDDTLMLALTHTNTHDARAVIERIFNDVLKAIDTPVFVGISHVTGLTPNLKNLTECSQKALQKAKDQGVSGVQYFTEETLPEESPSN